MIRKLMLCCFGALLVVSALFFSQIYALYHRPMPLEQADKPLILAVDQHSSAIAFARSLDQKGLIYAAQPLIVLMRYKGYANQLKAGFYEVKPGMTAVQLLEQVVNGDVMVLPFRITDGATWLSIAAQIEKAPYLTQTPAAWETVSAHYPSAEGLLLADTYYYDAGSTSLKLLMTAHNSLMHYLNNAFSKRDANLPYKTPYDMLIAASIIEKESSKPKDRRLISSVIVNRLRIRMPLQMDPTVIYGLGSRYQGQLKHEDLSINSPYNTYKHYGLPPTPIAMVGKDAIDAAAHPATTRFFYFVASGNGCHHFSETYEQQRRAISAYRVKVDACQD